MSASTKGESTLNGTVATVTGASSGIGAATAGMLAADGAAVAVAVNEGLIRPTEQER